MPICRKGALWVLELYDFTYRAGYSANCTALQLVVADPLTGWVGVTTYPPTGAWDFTRLWAAITAAWSGERQDAAL